MEISLRKCLEKTSADCPIFILCKDTIKLIFLKISLVLQGLLRVIQLKW